MKKLLLLAAIAVTTLGYSQSNEQGTIHISLLGGISSGNVTDKPDCDGCEDFKSKFLSGAYALDLQYGFTENISAGISVKTGSYLLTPKELTTGDDGSLDFGTISQTMSKFDVGLSARYYVVNNDDFNFYAGPSLGFSSASDKFAGIDISADGGFKASGLNYGANLGINYYIWGNVGGIFQIGYEAGSLSGEIKEEGEDTIDVKRSIGGLNIMAGLAIKIQ